MTRLLACTLACAAIASPLARAGAGDPAALLDKVEQAGQKVTTLSGDFVQTNRLKLFKQELSSKGRFAFERPRRIRWEYTDPDPSVLVLDGDRATLRSPGAEPQVFDLAHDATMRAIFDQLLLWLGAGSLKTASTDYVISSTGTDAAPALTLVPRASSPVAKVMARIELRFDRSFLLQEILLREASGDEKDIRFTHVQRNQKLAPDSFRQ